MRNASLAALLLGTAALSSCGGEGSAPAPIATTPAPVPAPTPAPTPSPTPAPTTYQRFSDLAGRQNFNTGCELATTRGAGAPGPSGPIDFLQSKTITYEPQNATWTINLGSDDLERSFGPTERVSSTASSILWKRPSPRSGGPDQTFEVFSASPTNAPDLIYSRVALLNFQNTTGFSVWGSCIFGVPTVASDVPKDANLSWDRLFVSGMVLTVGSGDSIVKSAITGGNGTVVRDAQTGQVRIDFSFDTQGPNGASTRTAVSGEVRYSELEGRAGYYGRIDQTKPSYQINGGFFGPKATETSFAFSAYQDDDGKAEIEKTVIGFVAARR